MSRSEDESEGRKASARLESTNSEGDTKEERRSRGRDSGYLLLLLICLVALEVLLENAQGE